MTYIGSSGSMIHLEGINAVSDEDAELYTDMTTLEGAVKAQRIPLSRRSWGLELKDTARPDAVSTVRDFARGLWGLGPWWFLPPDAVVVNALTPDAAALDEYVLGSGLLAPTVSGPWVTPDGRSPRSLIKGPENSLFFGAEGAGGRSPVIPGRQSTGSCYVSGDGARAGIQWYDAAGAPIGTVTGNAGTAGTCTRSHVTATPPANAVSLRVYVNAETTKLARPALTYTPQLTGWGDGRGCAKVIIRRASGSLSNVYSHTVLQGLGLMAQEVG